MLHPPPCGAHPLRSPLGIMSGPPAVRATWAACVQKRQPGLQVLAEPSRFRASSICVSRVFRVTLAVRAAVGADVMVSVRIQAGREYTGYRGRGALEPSAIAIVSAGANCPVSRFQ